VSKSFEFVAFGLESRLRFVECFLKFFDSSVETRFRLRGTIYRECRVVSEEVGEEEMGSTIGE